MGEGVGNDIFPFFLQDRFGIFIKIFYNKKLKTAATHPIPIVIATLKGLMMDELLL